RRSHDVGGPPNADIGTFTKEDDEVVPAKKRDSCARTPPAVFATLRTSTCTFPLATSWRPPQPTHPLCSTAHCARSCSRFLTMDTARLLEHFGAETKSYDPHGLLLPDDGRRPISPMPDTWAGYRLLPIS